MLPYAGRHDRCRTGRCRRATASPRSASSSPRSPAPVVTSKFARRRSTSRRASAPRCRCSSRRPAAAILVDVDGNSLIDLGSGHRRRQRRQRRARAWSTGCVEQVAAFTHTCFMVTPYEGYVDVCEQLAALTPGDHAKKRALFNSGAEAVENAVKIARAFTGRDAVVVFDHAYHGRTNLTMAMTAKNMPYKHGFGPFAGEVYRVPMSYPFRERVAASAARRPPPARSTCSRSRSAPANLAGLVIEPILGEGGFVVPAPGFLPALARVDRGATASCSSPTRSRPASAARATGSPATHEGVVPDLVTTGQGDRRRASRWPRSPAAPRSWTRCTSAGWAAPTAATRSPAPPRWARSRPCEEHDLPAARPRDRRRSCTRG